MYLINTEYFTGKYEIPDINESHTGGADLLTQFIDTEVPFFMQNLLGLELFKEFDSYMTDGVLQVDAPQKWLDLVNGVEYDGKKWNGLIYTIGNYQKSLLTNYIWARYFIEKNRIDGNGNSNVIATKNAVNGNPANQYYPIWNEFVSQVCFVPLYYSEYYDFPNYPNYPYYGSFQSDFVTLNQFLYDNRDNYPNIKYIFVEFENRFL